MEEKIKPHKNQNFATSLNKSFTMTVIAMVVMTVIMIAIIKNLIWKNFHENGNKIHNFDNNNSVNKKISPIKFHENSDDNNRSGEEFDSITFHEDGDKIHNVDNDGNHLVLKPKRFYGRGDEIHDVDNDIDDEEFATIKFHEDGKGCDDADISCNYYGDSNDKEFVAIKFHGGRFYMLILHVITMVIEVVRNLIPKGFIMMVKNLMILIVITMRRAIRIQ